MYKRATVKDIFVELLRRKSIILGINPSDNEIGRETGLPQATVTRVHNGSVKNPETPTLQARAFLLPINTVDV